MKVIIALAVLVAVVAAVPVDYIEPPKILKSEFLQDPLGSYVFSFETEDGIHRDEAGEVKQVLDEENKTHDVVIVKGSYTYTDNEGHVETIHYYADENGYHADGDSIPKPVEPVRR